MLFKSLAAGRGQSHKHTLLTATLVFTASHFLPFSLPCGATVQTGGYSFSYNEWCVSVWVLTEQSRSGRRLCRGGSWCPPRAPRRPLFPGNKKRKNTINNTVLYMYKWLQMKCSLGFRHGSKPETNRRKVMTQKCSTFARNFFKKTATLCCKSISVLRFSWRHWRCWIRKWRKRLLLNNKHLKCRRLYIMSKLHSISISMSINNNVAVVFMPNLDVILSWWSNYTVSIA